MSRARTGRRGPLALAALALALACAVGTGWYSYARLQPQPAAASLRPGQGVELRGIRYTLDSFTVAASLPAEDAGDPPVGGPDGSRLVLVVVSQTVLDRGVVLDDVGCDMTLVSEPGDARSTVWSTGSDAAGSARRPEAYSCGSSSSHPLAYDVARPMGFGFVIPADQEGRVLARLEVFGGGPLIALRP